MEINGVEGTAFAVWAPNALRVSVVGNFNNWDGRCHMMHRMPMSGIFELFIPGVKAGEIYKYEIKLKGGAVQLKSDPYAACTEVPPASASVVTDLRGFKWDDEAWIVKDSAIVNSRFLFMRPVFPNGKMLPSLLNILKI